MSPLRVCRCESPALSANPRQEGLCLRCTGRIPAEPNDALVFNAGEVLTVRTKDGHRLRGKVTMRSPAIIWLTYMGGQHVVFTGQISSVDRS